MEEVLNNCKGKKIDVACGTVAVYRGVVSEIRDGILVLKDDDGQSAYISIDKISVVYECSESSARPGFVS